MDKTTPHHMPELAEFRKQIDAIDDKIIDLLIERTGIVSQVGEMKRRLAPGQCPIRAGREAEMVRRIIEKFKGSNFPASGAAAIWRILIGASTSVEGALKISAYTPENNNDLYWMAREYFGPFLPITKQGHAKRVIGDVMDGKANIGIVPLPRSSEDSNWWTSLMQQGADAPKIFAHVPFVYFGPTGKDALGGLAIARVAPEQTAEDISLVVIEADQNVSQNRLQTAFSAAKLEASWLNIATLNPTSRHHLLEIKGFITSDHENMKTVLAALNSSVLSVNYLGAYAVPVTIENSYATPETVTPHVSRSAK